MSCPSKYLVRDRFAEFQRIAQDKGSLPLEEGRATPTPLNGGKSTGKCLSADGRATTPLNGGKSKASGLESTGTSGVAAAAPNGRAFMREFFEVIGEIQKVLNQGGDNVKAIQDLLEASLQATTNEKQKAVSDRLSALVEDTNGAIRNVKSALEVLKARSEEEESRRPSSAEGRIRANMQQSMTKKHQQLLVDFQKAQRDFKESLQQRQARELQLVLPGTSEAEVMQMIEAGETSSMLVARKMAGTHALLIDEIQRIRDKHMDILRIERSMVDLNQMFQEMAVLVDAQGEMLDAIEVHVHKTKGYTEKAEQNLITTRKTQRNTRKWMCWLTIIIMVLLVLILTPILLKA